ncbi:MAG: hypothetical protein WCW56_01970 [Candidatus Paceibacterota bacterium]|jgi:hypothetical protein
MIKVGGYKKTIIIATLFVMLFALLGPLKTFAAGESWAARLGVATRNFISYSIDNTPGINYMVATGIIPPSEYTMAQSNASQYLDQLKKQREAMRAVLARNYASDPNILLDDITRTNLNNTIANYDKIISDTDAIKRMAAVDVAATRPKNESTCSFTNFSIGRCLVEAINWFFSLISGTISSVFLIIGGKILDVSIWISIEKMQSLLEMAGIIYVWTLARDLANMALIFILLYTAFNIIVDRSAGGDPKKLITAVIVVALMVNFSGFFVRAVVDVSNVLAYEFYQVLSGGSQSGSGWGIGGKFLANMEVGKLMKNTFDAFGSNNGASDYGLSVQNMSLGKAFGNFLLGTVFAIFTAFVFIYIAILFFLRTVTVLGIFMISPLIVLAYAIPGQQGKFYNWLKKLIDQAIFAPVLLFLLYGILKIMEKGLPITESDYTGVSGALFGGLITQVVFYSIILGLILKSVSLAKDLGAMGSDLAKGWAGKATGAILGGGTAAAAAIGSRMGSFPATKRAGAAFNRWYGSEKFGAGTARAIGRSASGQAIGTFARSPISGTLTGVGKLGGTFGGNPINMGTATSWANMAEESKKNREKQLEERTFGSGDNKFSDEAVMANFMGLGAADQRFAYSKMSEKQRALLDHTLANPTNKSSIVDSILKAEKLDSASIALITDPGKQQEARIKANSRRKEVSEKIDPILDDPTKITATQGSVTGLKNVLSGKDKTEINKAYRNIEGKAESSAGKNIAKEILDNPTRNVDDNIWTGSTATTTEIDGRKASIRSINNDDIVSMFETDPVKFLAAENFVKFLTGKQLKSLVNNSTISKVQSSDVVRVLNDYDARLTAAGLSDKDLANALTFIGKNPEFF